VLPLLPLLGEDDVRGELDACVHTTREGLDGENLLGGERRDGEEGVRMK
jgi:hypothetical protein